ncbi:MAG: adenine deaminase, partial [Planifilum fulgidum]
DWSRYGELVTTFSWRADADRFSLALPSGGSYPVIQLLNPVITRVTEEALPLRGGRVQLPPEDDRLLAHLVDRDGTWIPRGDLRGFGRGIDGLASTYNGSGDLLVLGQRPDAMARAANRALEQGGGIVWIQGGEERFNLPLPIAGAMSERPVDELISLTERLTRELKAFGHPFHDPIYTFLFLSSTHLPQVRLTARGLLRIKDGRVLVPSEPLK